MSFHRQDQGAAILEVGPDHVTKSHKATNGLHFICWTDTMTQPGGCTMSSTDRIQKQVRLKAPRSRVWRALTDAQEFGTWFRVKLETGFAVGQVACGHITYPGYEHLKFEATVE